MVLAFTMQGWAQTENLSIVEKKQASDDRALRIIPKVGLNWSTTTLDSWVSEAAGLEKPDVKGLIGPVGGVELEYQFNKFLGASFGAFYSMQGRKYDDMAAYTKMVMEGKLDDNKKAMVDTERHHYVNFPLTANFYVIPGLAIRTGVQLGLLFWKSGTADWPNDPEWGKLSKGSSPRKLDVSIPVGVSYALENGLLFDLRYNHGLTKISTTEQIEGKSRSVQFTIGYQLNLLK